MKSILCLTLALAITVLFASGEQQRILRRVIKSTPTANQLARVKLVTIRSPSSTAERGAVAEITSKEAANFGQRSANETANVASPKQQVVAPTKSKLPAPQTTTAATSSTSSTAASQPLPSAQQPSQTTTTTTTSAPSSTSAAPAETATAPTSSNKEPRHKASDRQQASSQAGEVELLSSAPSSWQMMTAVEAPAAAALIAAGTRPAVATPVASASQDLSSSSSEESLATGDFLRAGGSATKGSYTQSQSVDETFSRLRQQSSKTSQQQQSYFYPQQQRATGKTSTYQATKTHWYQPTPTTPRPAPIIQEQQYEQQNEQYVEQQQVEGAAPLGQAEPFAFDFKTQDNSGNGQYRKEESDKNGVVRGSYGYTDANGIYRHVEYVADQNGFRANIKSNEPGLIGETQPASIRLDGGAAPPQAASQRFSASSGNNEQADWTASAGNNDNERADLAVAPPDFESAHKSDRLRSPRHFRN